MSEPELRRAVDACVESLARRGRPHLAARVGAKLERLIGGGDTAQALAILALFGGRPA